MFLQHIPFVYNQTHISHQKSDSFLGKTKVCPSWASASEQQVAKGVSDAGSPAHQWGGGGTLVQTSPLGFSFLLSNGHNYSADVTGLWRE